MQIQASGSDLNGAIDLIGAEKKVRGKVRQNTFYKILNGAEIIEENFGFELSVPCIEGNTKYMNKAGSRTDVEYRCFCTS